MEELDRNAVPIRDVVGGRDVPGESPPRDRPLIRRLHQARRHAVLGATLEDDRDRLDEPRRASIADVLAITTTSTRSLTRVLRRPPAYWRV